MTVKLILSAVFLMVCLAGLGFVSIKYESKQKRESPDYYEWAVENYEFQDAINPPPSRAIVFVGSSSIRLWTKLERDLGFAPVFARGFGGAHLQHITHNIERLALKHDPIGVIVYAGENDVAGGDSSEQVVDELLELVARIKDTSASRSQSVKVGLMLIKPSPKWRRSWRTIRLINQKLTELSTQGDFFVIDTASVLLTGKSEISTYFQKDQVHLNESGYRVWSAVVRESLLSHFPEHAM